MFRMEPATTARISNACLRDTVYCQDPSLDERYLCTLPYGIHRGTEEMMGALTGRWFQLQYR